MRVITTIRAALGHARTLASAAVRRRGRRRLAHDAALLSVAAERLRAGGVPALVEVLDTAALDDNRGLELAVAEVDAVAAVWPQPGLRRCLRRAVLRYVVLRARGAAPTLVIGAARTRASRGLAGHAWIELNGAPYREPGEQWRSMTEMVRHPPWPDDREERAARSDPNFPASE